jgi:lipopolysaccharide export system permease protein
MRLLDRYLLRELLVPLGFCLSGFLLLVISADLITQVGTFQKNHLLFGDIVEYYLAAVPGYLVLILPITLLLAALYALTSHARNQEITAIRAAGISMWRLCYSYLLVGVLASVALFVLNEVYVPNSDDVQDQILARRLPPKRGALPRTQEAHLCFFNAGGHRSWQIGIYDKTTGEMRNPLVIWTLTDGTEVWLPAKRAARVNGVWTFYEVEESRRAPEAKETAPYLKTNILAFPEFSETPDQIKSEIKIGKVKGNLKAAQKTDLSLREILDYLRLHPDLVRTDVYWLYTKLYGRLAMPWTCVVAILIAVPFGAASGRRNVYVGVASSVVIFLAYYILQQLGLSLGSGGYVTPFLAAWLPNLVFGCIGLVMTARVR